jgi:bifunctional DNA-binding transcriptional regulator/antitoxin component of YhaV-PrlF toxin-antitoxin module
VVDDRSGRTGRSEVALNDRGRFALPREVRERYGDRCHVVAVHDGVRFVPTEDDPDARGA